MKCDEIMQREDFKKTVDFHGHFCPGVAIGYRAATAALDYFESDRSEDEELVAIVENDACGVDAVQALTGCTFGKGNLIFKDYGKQVFYFILRSSGKTIRISMKNNPFKPTDEQKTIAEKVKNGTAGGEETNIFNKFRHEKACRFLEMPFDEMFSIKEVDMEIPDKARVMGSEPCDLCGEPTMIVKLNDRDGKKICGECIEDEI